MSNTPSSDGFDNPTSEQMFRSELLHLLERREQGRLEIEVFAKKIEGVLKAMRGTPPTHYELGFLCEAWGRRAWKCDSQCDKCFRAQHESSFQSETGTSECPTCGGDGKLTDQPGTFKACHTCAGCGRVAPASFQSADRAIAEHQRDFDAKVERTLADMPTDKWERVKLLHDTLQPLISKHKLPWLETWKEIPDAEKDCMAEAIEIAFPSATGRWIPVSERLPDESGWYLVWTPSGEGRPWECCHKGHFFAGSWMANGNRVTPTQWMPLPECTHPYVPGKVKIPKKWRCVCCRSPNAAWRERCWRCHARRISTDIGEIG